MAQSRSDRYWKLGLVSFLVIGGVIVFNKNTLAQIKPDSSLGIESSQVTHTNPKVFQIEKGATREGNLFHSFSQFSVPAGSTAYFKNGPDIHNIISRVTGSSISHIDGIIKAEGSANLFLINPHGIIFGSDASLTIGGSFVGSTASSLQFADGTQFKATASRTPPLLTVSVPTGLQFRGTAAHIRAQEGTNLKVQLGRSLGLIGGEVVLEGSELEAPGGRIELGSVASNSLVNLNQMLNGWSFEYNEVHNFQDISVTRERSGGYGSALDASGPSGGSIHLQGRKVMITDYSQIYSTTQGTGRGGNLTIDASELISISSGSSLASATIDAGTGGDIVLNTKKLLVSSLGAFVSTESSFFKDPSGQITLATGDAGNLTVNASDSVELTSTGFLSSNTFGQGDAGNITIRTGKLIIQDDMTGVFVSSTGDTGAGTAGNIQVKAGSLLLDGGATIAANTTGGEGNIDLTTWNLTLRRNSKITANARGTNTIGGNITINTNSLVAVPQENSDISADSPDSRGGNVSINASTVSGIQFNPKDMDLSGITAIGKDPTFNGSVQINDFYTDPSQGLVTLPTQPVNVTGIIAQGCPADGGNLASKFVVTGRGGLPENPNQTLSSDTVWSDVRSPTRLAVYQPSSEPATQPTNSATTEQLVEAQGWMTNDKGEVVLTVAAPSITPHSPWMTPTGCHAP